MVATAPISEEEYLRTHFESPEPDYVEGQLIQRPIPDAFHSATQVNLLDAFKPWQDIGELFRLISIRLRVLPKRFRVADFALFTSKPAQGILESLPYAVVEIVSPDESFDELTDKLHDYEEAGVEFLFVADPPKSKLFRYRHGDLHSVSALELPSFRAAIPVSAIFG
jgi:Uma2 family endonuclease